MTNNQRRMKLTTEQKQSLLRLAFASLFLVLLGAGCVSPDRSLFPPQPGQPTKTVYVIRRHVHTGVIVRAADIPPGVWPEHKLFPNAEYLEVGWGDTKGYRYPWTSPVVVRALTASEGSVLLIHAFSQPVTEEYTGIARQIVEVKLSEPGFARMCEFIQKTYILDASGKPIRLESSRRDQVFFKATGHYSAFHNCNNWTAKALRTAGCPTTPRFAFLPTLVMFQARRFGTVVPLGWTTRKPRVDSPPSGSKLALTQ